MRLSCRYASVLSCIAAPLGAQAAMPLPVEAALRQRTFAAFSPILLSPNGQWVAYTATTPHTERRSFGERAFTQSGVSLELLGTSAWVANTRTGVTIRLAPQAANSWVPSWSPDGRRVAFYSDQGGTAGLWTWDVASRRAHRVSDVIVRVVVAHQAPRWLPDGRRVITPIVPYGSRLPEESQGAPSCTSSMKAKRGTTVKVLRADRLLPYGGPDSAAVGAPQAGDTFGAYAADLAAIDVATGAVMTLARGYRPFAYKASPDGRQVALTTIEPYQKSSEIQNRFSLITVALESRAPHAPRVIVRDQVVADFGRSLEWSPDGSTLLYSTLDSAGVEHYYVVRPSNGSVAQVAERSGEALPAERRSSMGQSLWWREDGGAFYVLSPKQLATVGMPDGIVRSIIRAPAQYAMLGLVGASMRGTAWESGDGSRVIAMVRNDSTKSVGFAYINVRTGAWTIVREENRSYGPRGFMPTDIASGGRLVYLSESAQQAPDIWRASTDFSSVRQVTHLAPELERFRYGATRLIDWTTEAGTRRFGTLLLPVGYEAGKRYPLVVYPYPLSYRSDLLNTYGVTGTGVENMQLLATRGFAILAPDVPPVRTMDQMRDLAATILSATNRVIELGIADTNRLGIMGHSWGGYTVLSTIVQTNRFRAAIMRGGYGDLTAHAGRREASGFAPGLLIDESWLKGLPWDQRARYVENSPIFFMDRARTPLLIVHGEQETTVPILLADQVFVALQRLGREVEYARYAGEDHGEGSWTYANQRDFLERVIHWLSTYLQQPPSHDMDVRRTPKIGKSRTSR